MLEKADLKREQHAPGNARRERIQERTAMRTAEIMTAPVISVGPDATLLEAAQLMLRHRVSGLPVTDAGELVGILSEADFLRRTKNGTEGPYSLLLEFLMSSDRPALEYAHAPASKVREVMTRTFVSVSPDTPLDQVMKLMERHCIKRLPVLEEGRLVGIVSRADLLRALADILTVNAVADAVGVASRSTKKARQQ